MTYDFHYYMTYIAARIAGFTRHEAELIALCAEFVDETYSDYLLNQLRHPFTHHAAMKTDTGDTVTRTVYDASSYAGMANYMLKYKGYKEEFVAPWIAFHFLPGGHGHSYSFNPHQLNNKTNTLQQEMQNLAVLQDTSQRVYFRGVKVKLTETKMKKTEKKLEKWDLQERLICAPESYLSDSMMMEFIDQTGPAWTYVENELTMSRNKQDGPGFNPELFWLTLLGIRMHVLADTWAHAGFAGMRSKKVNDIANIEFLGKSHNVMRTSARWNTLAIRDETGKRAPSGPFVGAYFGHGRIGSHPDTPAHRYRWTRPWDGETFERDGPTTFFRAFNAMVLWMRRFRTLLWEGKMEDLPEDEVHQFAGRLTIDETYFGETLDNDDVMVRSEIIRGHIYEYDGIDLGAYKASHAWRFGMGPHILTHFSKAARWHLDWFTNNIQHEAALETSLSTVVKEVYVKGLTAW